MGTSGLLSSNQFQHLVSILLNILLAILYYYKTVKESIYNVIKNKHAYNIFNIEEQLCNVRKKYKKLSSLKKILFWFYALILYS